MKENENKKGLAPEETKKVSGGENRLKLSNEELSELAPHKFSPKIAYGFEAPRFDLPLKNLEKELHKPSESEKNDDKK